MSGINYKIATDSGPFEAGEQECEHMQLIYNDAAQTVECERCGKTLTPYFAFKHVLGLLSEVQWQREAVERYKQSDRQRKLRLQLSCKHTATIKVCINAKICDRCGFLLDGSKQPGEAYYEHSRGRVVEIKDANKPRLAISNKQEAGK